MRYNLQKYQKLKKICFKLIQPKAIFKLSSYLILSAICLSDSMIFEISISKHLFPTYFTLLHLMKKLFILFKLLYDTKKYLIVLRYSKLGLKNSES